MWLCFNQWNMRKKIGFTLHISPCCYLPSGWLEWRCFLGQIWKLCVKGGRASPLPVPEILPAEEPPCHPAVNRGRNEFLLCLNHYTLQGLSLMALSLHYVITNVVHMSLYFNIKDRNSSLTVEEKIPQNSQPKPKTVLTACLCPRTPGGPYLKPGVDVWEDHLVYL